MESIRPVRNNFRGDNPSKDGPKASAPMPKTEHLETPRSMMASHDQQHQHGTTRPSTGQPALNEVDNALSDYQQSTGGGHQRTALPSGRRAAPARQIHDESSAPDHKPAFTRGLSVMDQTAVTSTAPTPAGEIQNPMSFGVGRSVSRQRESHLPDEDLRKQVRAMSKGEPLDDGGGDDDDEVGEDLSRQETLKGS